ncbi:hypothetical protein D3C84_677530 [compost metagenome]
MGEHGQGVVEVVLGTEQGRFIAGFGPSPVLAHVGAAVGGGGNFHARGDEERTGRGVELFFLADQVQGGSQAITLIVQGDGADVDVPGLIVDGRVTLLGAAVDAHTEAAFFAEAPADIDVAADLRIHGVAGGETGQVLIEGTLGDYVDHATDTAVGRHAVQQGAGALDHFDTLGVFGEDPVVGRNAVHPVECQFAEVAFAHRETANEEGIDNAAGLASGAYRGVALQHIGHCHGLLIFH